MKKKYYHATPYENLPSILENGIMPGFEGIVYLCETATDSLKFVAIRGCQDILVIEVELNEDDVIETFDHSEAFFKCKAFGYQETIQVSQMTKYTRYK